MAANDINMANIDNEHDFPRYDDHTEEPVTPPAVDPSRPPIYNEENTCQCACDCTRARDSDGGTVDSTANYAETSIYDSPTDGYNSYASSIHSNDRDDGDEGAEDHLIDCGDFGKIPEKEIIRALIKHGRIPALSNAYATSCATPSSANSMLVETGSESDDQSMTSSIMSHFSCGSSAYGHTGEWVHHQHQHHQHQHHHGFLNMDSPLIYAPLRLTAEVAFENPLREFGER